MEIPAKTIQRTFFSAAALLFSFSLTSVPRIDASEASSSRPRSESTQPDQQPKKPGASPTPIPIQCQSGEVRDHDKITVAGCLAGVNGKFAFSTYSGQRYDLIDDTALVNKHGGWPPGNNVCVVGTLSADAPAINVVSISDLPKRVESLSPSIGRPSQWPQRTNKTYGLSFALPETFPATKDDDQYIQSNFPVASGVITLAKFAIPANTFGSPDLPGCGPLSSFFGGGLALFVNPEINNRPACDEFGQSDPKYRASHTLHGIKFSETSDVSAGTGHYYSYDFYHTFQNGLCYEFVFSSAGGAINPDDPCGCVVPVVSGYDAFVHTILSQLSFSKPQAETVASSDTSATPKVTSFTASASTSGDPKSRGPITFSWTTQNADFVRISYRCTGGEEIIKQGLPNLGLDGLVIMEKGAIGKGCGGKYGAHQIVDHSPNSSVDVGFGNASYNAPVEVRVTLTPFSNGVAYAKSGETIAIGVYPDNPFLKGFPAPTKNITFLSPANANGVSSYRQGSSSKIEWTDSHKGDDHFWLHLVRDNASNSMTYLYQVAGYVPRTGNSISYTWVVPKSYSGSGFRIFINSEEHRVNKVPSYAVSPPFSIAP